MWIVFAFGSALFAGLTAVLAKCGIKKDRFGCCDSCSDGDRAHLLVADGVDCRLGIYHHRDRHAIMDIPCTLGHGYRCIMALLFSCARTR